MSTPVSASAPKPSAALTPVSRSDYTNLRTPHRASQDPVTRTPTPFKDALAEMEKKGGPINYILHTPTRFEDLNEIIGKDSDPSHTALHTPVQNLLQDSGYLTGKRHASSGGSNLSASGKENVPGTTGFVAKSPIRKSRKALHATWSTPGNIHVPGISCDTISFLPETPVSFQVVNIITGN